MTSSQLPSSTNAPATFGVAVLCVSSTVAWVLWRGFENALFSGAILAVGGLFACCYYGVRTWRPRMRSSVLKLTHPVRWMATQFVLLVSFALVLFPLSLWYRFSGRSIFVNNDHDDSNWRSVEDRSETDSFFRTF